jgi:hypothetical protein
MDVGYYILTEMVKNGFVSWDTMPYTPLKIGQHFRGIFHLHIQYWRVSQEAKMK